MNPLMPKKEKKEEKKKHWIVQKEWKRYILKINEVEQNTLFISSGKVLRVTQQQCFWQEKESERERELTVSTDEANTTLHHQGNDLAGLLREGKKKKKNRK